MNEPVELNEDETECPECQGYGFSANWLSEDFYLEDACRTCGGHGHV